MAASMEEPIITMSLVSAEDNSAQQYISANRLKKLEAIEKAATRLVSLRRSFELGYRDLEDTFLKFKE